MTSRLVEDIIALERDFTHNLSLLKIRESEIERCSKTNRALEESLDSARSELHSLHVKYIHSTSALEKMEASNKDEEQRYKRQTELLEQRLNQCWEKECQMKGEYEKCLEAREQELRRFYEKQLDAQKKIFEKLNMDLHKKYDKENKAIRQLQANLDEVVEKNLELQNKTRALETLHVNDSCFYKSEKELNQSRLEDMQKEVERLTQESKALKKQLEDIDNDNRTLRDNSANQSDTLYSLNRENESLRNVNSELQMKLEQQDDILKELQSKIKNLICDKDHLFEELQNMNVQSNNTYDDGRICSVPEHAKFESIVRQNQILQDVIKESRRNKGVPPENLIAEATKKIEKLERLVEQLKTVIINRRLKPEDFELSCIPSGHVV